MAIHHLNPLQRLERKEDDDGRDTDSRLKLSENDPKYWRKIKNLYGLSIEQFHLMLRLQKGKCAICRQEPQPLRDGRTGWMIDHCHKTDKVRGLLCKNCNWMLGQAKDSPEILRLGAIYLDDFWHELAA